MSRKTDSWLNKGQGRGHTAKPMTQDKIDKIARKAAKQGTYADGHGTIRYNVPKAK